MKRDFTFVNYEAIVESFLGYWNSALRYIQSLYCKYKLKRQLDSPKKLEMADSKYTDRKHTARF